MTQPTQPATVAPMEDLGIEEAPPRRTGPKPVTTVEELQTLDQETTVRGYRAGLANAADWAEHERSYWHGYLNGLVDGGHAKVSDEQMQLTRAYVASGALKQDVTQWRAILGATGA